ncbi:3-isopropylmalate dehydratase small subunit [Candidatus Haliotispira prima]|uniref:3-isopropylmalate dehydratase small subunit n=1 Tax=Candidatus Haliotispira prima TaxID=3034016 RepID=A0ABY8MH67_9SPIO|nr:3-isopropylmalate dehydratase small subunit [Candidatus Haliotispira prima]
MEKFTVVTGVAAPLNIDNIDTDMLIPKGFLKTIKRTGLGINLFQEMRYDSDGKEIPDFVLNREPYRKAGILVSGKNFGCGSSREHAPWALADFGIRVILAESFADIFFSNTVKNGILALALPSQQIQELRELSEQGLEFTVDLVRQVLEAGDKVFRFEVEDFRRKRLLEGLDDIDLILESDAAISAYEQKLQESRPWLA